jgi:hypothetical protein
VVLVSPRLQSVVLVTPRSQSVALVLLGQSVVLVAPMLQYDTCNS